MTRVMCRLNAKNWDQLWNPMLGNRVWATITFFTYLHTYIHTYRFIDLWQPRAGLHSTHCHCFIPSLIYCDCVNMAEHIIQLNQFLLQTVEQYVYVSVEFLEFLGIKIRLQFLCSR